MEAQRQQPSTVPAAAVSSVLGNADLLRRILLQLDVPTELVHTMLVSRQWLAATSDPAFLRDFRALHPPRLVGFLAVFGRKPRGEEEWDDDDDHVDDAASNSDEEAGDDDDDDDVDDDANYGDDDDAMTGDSDSDDDEVVSDADDITRFVQLPHLPTFAGGAARLVAAAFNFNDDVGPPPDLVRDCRNGRILVVPSGQTGTYAMHRPLRFTASGAADVTELPALSLPVEHIEEPDRYVAQVVLVEPGTDALSSFHSYELTYPRRLRSQTTARVIDVELRVNILQGGAWVTHTSSGFGLQVQKPLEPLEFPYNLLVGNTFYMFTIVGYVAVFDMVAHNFSLVKLPDGMSCGEGGVLDHRFVRAGDTGLYLVRVKGLELHIFRHLQAMEVAGAVWEWELVDTIFLPTVFGDILGVPLGDEPMFIEVFAVGDDAEYVFLTVGGNRGLFLLDVKTREVENVLQISRKKDGFLYRVFPFVMPWPPVFPALVEGPNN